CRGRRLWCGPMDAPAAEVTLSPDDVRRMALRAQGFLGATSWPRSRASRSGVTTMLHRVGAVQLDTISVLARSHELVAYARLGPVSRQAIEQAYWHASAPAAFEYWAHAACVLPIEQWPYFAFRRRAFKARGERWHRVSPETCEKVLARLRAEGPLTATQLGGAKGGGAWWDWSDVKIAVEWLLDTGEVICVRRTGWRRVYDVPERVLPDDLLGAEPSDAECLAHLAGVTARALGVATQADLAEYHRLHFTPGRPGRSGPGRQDPRRPPGIPGSRDRRRTHGPGPAGGGVLGRLRRRPPRASRAGDVGPAPGGRPHARELRDRAN